MAIVKQKPISATKCRNLLRFTEDASVRRSSSSSSSSSPAVVLPYTVSPWMLEFAESSNTTNVFACSSLVLVKNGSEGVWRNMDDDLDVLFHSAFSSRYAIRLSKLDSRTKDLLGFGLSNGGVEERLGG